MILRSGEGLTSFNKNNRANFSAEKKSEMKLSGVSIFLELKSNVVLVVVLVLESKGL